MKKFILFILLLVTTGAWAQRSELGVFAGGSYYLGDLNPSQHFGNSSFAFGGIYRYNLTTRWTLKFNALYGNLIGDDASAVGADKQRNLSFKSNILDFSGQLELNFLPYFTGSRKHTFTPYIFAGLSLFRFNPKAELGGEWYELQPLGTEGQGTTAYPNRKAYSLTQVGFPFGLGIKISTSKYTCLGLEWSLRKTFTDYLDDVSTTYPDSMIMKMERGIIASQLSNRSILAPGEPPIETGEQRGNSRTKDWYSFVGVTFTVKIVTGKDHGCRDFQRGHKYDEFIFEK